MYYFNNFIMNIKTVCKLHLKREKGGCSYTSYRIYPLASMFASSDDDAMLSYIKEITSPHMEIQECNIMEVSLEYGETLRFYRVKKRNTTLECDIVTDYLVIDVPLIAS